MTESDWWACQEPQAMLEFLRDSDKGSDRKLRLFAVACYRQILEEGTLGDPHPAVVVSEGFAEGLLDERELRAARESVGGMGSYSARASAYHAAGATVEANAHAAARKTAGDAADYFGHLAVEGAGFVWDLFIPHRQAEWNVQAALLHDIFGPLPFRPVTLPPSVRTWNDGCVVQLATGIYEDRDFSPVRMGVLSDALEEAGVGDEEVLGHLRGAVSHCRGCWCVDLVLGKG